MKLGTETGSIINHTMASAATEAPEVGMGATLLGWTDRSPATVIGTVGKQIIVQEDTYERIDTNGMSECQEYAYSRDPEGHKYTFEMRRGQWVEVRHNAETGRWKKAGSKGLRLGTRERYYDFSF